MVCAALVVGLAVLYKKNQHAVNIRRNNRENIETNAFSNPVYGAPIYAPTPQTTNDTLSYYQDVEPETTEEKQLMRNAQNIDRYKLGLGPLSDSDEEV